MKLKAVGTILLDLGSLLAVLLTAVVLLPALVAILILMLVYICSIIY